MSSKNKATTTTEEARPALVPKLRFPEFRGTEAWKLITLHQASTPVTERVGERKLTPVSISAGIGFVSQAEKFGRDISGNQYQLYTAVKDGDFVFNKGNSLKFPQGCVYLLQGWGQVAAPNVFISFRLKDGYSKGFFQNCFEQNQHGRQLKRHITSGARSNGLLNISRGTFFGVEIPTPGRAEQEKIAECLSSVDELIAAQARKVDALKTHKKGLMQQLFPREGETQPRLRFPEFQNAAEWVSDSLGATFETTSGGTPSRTEKAYWNGNIPWITTSLVDFRVICSAEEFISAEGMANSSAKLFPKGTVLMAMYGQGKTRGQVALLGIEAATNQACAAILPRKGIDPYFVFTNLAARYDEIRGMSNSGGQENLSQGLIREIQFAFPPEEAEQRKVTSCLRSLDALIAAEAQKLEALKTHKKGLMQQLFPSSEEVEA
ncbi:restriction endonuclease subunit R [Paraburkholderia acidicola]|uniref:Restriction endonuclease subunit R n=1 Tax=Paraburkholderia acidicola TaxID=1912599 RepID=A0A2A4F0N0_9BURK|nr:restriction endonuclease subunit S [Paraburkholderia acidicola]PCE26134.1 restriction endonuclease subunit R [Paraburkholderia acidicola]